MSPDKWEALKQRGDALRQTARYNRQRFLGITEAMRASHQDALEEDYLEAMREEESELWPSV